MWSLSQERPCSIVHPHQLLTIKEELLYKDMCYDIFLTIVHVPTAEHELYAEGLGCGPGLNMWDHWGR